MKFESNKVYHIHLPLASFGSLNHTDINEIFSNGRNLSPFMEKQFAKWFDNITRKLESNFGDFTYNDGLNKPIEMRGFSSLGKTQKANLIPNYMIGVGRSYDRDKYLLALNDISGWIIVYPLKSYNNILVFHYSANDASKLEKKALSNKDVKSILNNISPDKIYKHIINNSNLQMDNIVNELNLDKIK